MPEYFEAKENEWLTYYVGKREVNFSRNCYYKKIKIFKLLQGCYGESCQIWTKTKPVR